MTKKNGLTEEQEDALMLVEEVLILGANALTDPEKKIKADEYIKRWREEAAVHLSRSNRDDDEKDGKMNEKVADLLYPSMRRGA